MFIYFHCFRVTVFWRFLIRSCFFSFFLISITVLTLFTIISMFDDNLVYVLQKLMKRARDQKKKHPMTYSRTQKNGYDISKNHSKVRKTKFFVRHEKYKIARKSWKILKFYRTYISNIETIFHVMWRSVYWRNTKYY